MIDIETMAFNSRVMAQAGWEGGFQFPKRITFDDLIEIEYITKITSK